MTPRHRVVARRVDQGVPERTSQGVVKGATRKRVVARRVVKGVEKRFVARQIVERQPRKRIVARRVVEGVPERTSQGVVKGAVLERRSRGRREEGTPEWVVGRRVIEGAEKRFVARQIVERQPNSGSSQDESSRESWSERRKAS